MRALAHRSAEAAREIRKLDSITQQNAAMVEQLSASATALRGQARIVSESVQVFHTEAGPAHPRT